MDEQDLDGLTEEQKELIIKLFLEEMEKHT